MIGFRWQTSLAELISEQLPLHDPVQRLLVKIILSSDVSLLNAQATLIETLSKTNVLLFRTVNMLLMKLLR